MSVALVSAEEVSCVDLFFYVAKVVGVKAVGKDHIALGLEFLKIVDDKAVEEAAAVFKCGLVYDDRDAFGLDALHDALDSGSAEVVAVALHGEAVNADYFGLHGNNAVSDEVLANGVGLDDSFDHCLGNVPIVGQQLLGVLGQAVAAVAEGRVVVMSADAGIHADAVNDLLGVESFGLRVGIQLVEIGDAHGEICVGEELDRFRFRGICDQDRNVLRLLTGFLFLCPCAFKEKVREHLRFFVLGLVGAYHNAARVEVVVESLGLAKEFRAENDVVDVIFCPDRVGIADRNGGLDDHQNVGVDSQSLLDRVLHCRCVKKVMHIIVIGRRCDDDELRGTVCGSLIRSCVEIEGALAVSRLGKESLDLIILDGRDELVELLSFGGSGGDRGHLVILCQEDGQ